MEISNVINLLVIILTIVAIYLVVTGAIKGKPKVITIVVIVVVIIFLITQSAMFTKEKKLSSNVRDASMMKFISSEKLKSYKSNYSYCVWFYIDDWNLKYGEKKRILTRPENNTSTSSDQPCNPDIYLSEMQNNLNIDIGYYDPSSDAVAIHNCVIENINIQKWVCLTMVLNTRSLDVFINGKLAKTCVIPGVPAINNDANVYLSANNSNLSEGAVCGTPPNDSDMCGFGGFLGKVIYYPEAKNPQQVWDIYRKGPGTSILGNILDKYQMKFIFSQDGKETKEVNLL